MTSDSRRKKKRIIGAVWAGAGGIALVLWLFLARREAPPEAAKTPAALRRASGSLARVGPDQRPLTSKIVGKVRSADGKATPALVYVLALLGVDTEADGAFKVTGPAVGQTVRLQFNAGGYIGDCHTATVKATGGNAGADIGSIKLIRGGWRSIEPRLLDWLLEGRIDNTMVVAVRPGSQAAEAGVVPGAVILKVGEKDAQRLGPISLHYLGSAAGAVASMVLRLPNGSIRTFQL